MIKIIIKQIITNKKYDYIHYLTQLTKSDANITHYLTVYDENQIYFRFFLRD